MRSQNVGCCQSLTKCEKCEGSAQSAKEVWNGCDKIYTLIFIIELWLLGQEIGACCAICHLGLCLGGFTGCIHYV